MSIGQADQVMDRLLGGVTAHEGDRFGQRNFFRTDLSTILGVTATGDAFFLLHDAEAGGGGVFAGGV